jgi:glucosamine-6-phosphate deaminase
MNIIKVANYQGLSEKAGMLIAEKIRANPSMTLGLATGSTPLGVYQYLIREHKENGTTYQNIKTVNLDEYIGIRADDPNSYHLFMEKNLFNHLDINHKNTYIPNGSAVDLDEECIRYEQLIKKGGIDLQILGIGQNGHIGFNEPGTSFQSRTHIVTLAENTRQANSRFFKTIEDVPTHALTMGIASILDSKEIFLMASGIKKAEAISRLLTGDISEDFPASALQMHDNVTVIADGEALKFFEENDR